MNLHKPKLFHWTEQLNHIGYLGAVAFGHHGLHVLMAGSLALLLIFNLLLTIRE